MFPLPRRAGDPVVDPVVAETSWSTRDRRIGGTQCTACDNSPSHLLLPCKHTVCYDHFLQHPEDLPVRCAQCLKPVTTTVEIKKTTEIAYPTIDDLATWTQGLRLSPTSTANSIWGSPLSAQSSFRSLDADIANMRRPLDAQRASPRPPAADEAQLGVTNRGVIDHSHTLSPRSTPSQAPSGQIQDVEAAQKHQPQPSKHTRFPSFNPGRSAVANFPEYVGAGHGQNAHEHKEISDGQTQQRQSGNGATESLIHAPQPSAFKPSHAFRELATPTPETGNSETASAQLQFVQHHVGQLQQSLGPVQPSVNMQQAPGPIQRPEPANMDPRSRGLMSPVNMDRPLLAPTMPAAMMRNLNLNAGPRGHEAAPPMRGPMPRSFNNMPTSFTGSGHLTNSAQVSGLDMNVPHSYDPRMNGPNMNGSNMNGPFMNRSHIMAPQMGLHMAPQMTPSYMQNPQVGHASMSAGQQMNPHQMYNSMPANINHGMPAQTDPFVDHRPPMYGNGPFMAGPNNHQPFVTAQSAHSAPMGNLGSNAGPAYTWGQAPQQTNNSVNVAQQPQANIVQQPQTNAARMAEAIRSGTLHQLDSRSPPHGRGYASPGAERAGNELVVQQPVVCSQAVMAPEVRPDPGWVNPEDRALPNLDEVYEHMPFVDTAAESRPSTNGVIKIGNIPYGTTKNEVVAALGRSTRIASQPKGTPYMAIHIIMERSTGKTMDVYVELNTAEEAKAAVTNFQQRCMNNRHPRIGDRHIEMELSSQEALMKELFPRAKCIKWDGHVPVVYASTEAYNSGFQGFVTSEEMVMITKHAETPQRSPFAQRCVNRTYETMISIMHKYPWHATDLITIRERTSIFSSAVVQLRVLMNAVTRNTHPQFLHRGLLQEYLTACLSNPGFSVQQKTYMVTCASNEGYGALLSMVPFTPVNQMTGSWWAFEVLSKNPKSSDSLLAYIIALLCSATNPEGAFVRTATTDPDSCLDFLDDDMVEESTFGHFGVKYKTKGKRDMHSLKEAAEAEWRALYEALSRVLPANRALTFGDFHQGGGQQRADAGADAGAEQDTTAFEGGQVLALPGLEQREDALVG
ncbi:hypothetical protein E4T48_07887 [Aureobasidium sp. EXF-10727]|nr:hypothetical protein E4T48_07887 [Aureobasidium sp. EXF-10727]